MSALGLRFAASGDAHVFAGEVLAVELAFTSGDSDTVPLTGRTFSLAVSVAKTREVLAAVAGEAVSDASGHYVRFAIAGEVTEELFVDHAGSALRVEIAELLDSGRDVWVEGALRVRSSAAAAAPGSSAPIGSAPVTRYTFDKPTRRVVVSARGAPGRPLAQHVAPPTDTWLVMSDSQPLPEAVERWRAQLAGLKHRHPEISQVLIAGDIVDNGDSSDPAIPDPYTFAEMIDDLAENSPVTLDRWLAIAGNHDIDYGLNAVGGGSGSTTQYGRTFRTFLSHFSRQFWAWKKGNVLVVGMSNMARNTGGNITDYVVAWWRDLVERHQDCVIVTMIHQPLLGTFGSTGQTTIQYESQRLIDVLQAATSRVDLVFSGHTGNPFTDGTGGFRTMFDSHFWNLQGMNTAAPHASYTLLRLTHGSAEIVLERYDADTGALLPAFSHSFNARYPARLAHQASLDTRNGYDERSGLIAWAQTIVGNVPRAETGTPGVFAPLAGPVEQLTLRLEDKYSDNVAAESGPMIRLDVPGAVSGGANADHAYGFGGAISVERLTNGDTDYSAGINLYASAPGREIDSSRRVMRLTPDTIEMHVNNLRNPFNADAGVPIARFSQSTGGLSAQFYNRGPGGNFTHAAGATCLGVGLTAAGRSISAGGTINASGADYAEYFEVKPALYGNVAKGALLGVGADGLLTDRWADVVGKVLVKSTDPNLVGNDRWGAVANIETKYGTPFAGDAAVAPIAPPAPFVAHDATAAERERLGAAHAGATAAHAAALDTYEEVRAEWSAREAAFAAALETERTRWDRMALCGQVPVNVTVTASDIGKLVVPIAGSDGGIGATLVTKSSASLAQYMRRIGEVVGVESDGRARVLVGA